MNNQNYHTGLDPLTRIRAVQDEINQQRGYVANAVSNIVGQPLALPAGYSLGVFGLSAPSVHVDGFGISSDGMLRCPESQGAVDGRFLELEPMRLLEITEGVERQGSEVIRVLKRYCKECGVLSASRMAQSVSVLSYLTSPSEAAAALRRIADTLSKD